VVGVVSYFDANTLTFVAPAKASSSYSLYVVNSDGGHQSLSPAYHIQMLRSGQHLLVLLDHRTKQMHLT
jgi:hypothetical protein